MVDPHLNTGFSRRPASFILMTGDQLVLEVPNFVNIDIKLSVHGI